MASYKVGTWRHGVLHADCHIWRSKGLFIQIGFWVILHPSIEKSALGLFLASHVAKLQNCQISFTGHSPGQAEGLAGCGHSKVVHST